MNAYFNTYYNASKSYDEAMKPIETILIKERNANRFLKIPTPTDSRTKFELVVEKCSKLLQYYPNSVFFDDALLMIGNSYFFMGEYFRAERKYIELRQNFPEGNLYAEATIGLAKTYYLTKRFADVFNVIGDSMTLVALNDGDFIAEGFFLQGQIYFEQKEFDKAVIKFTTGLEYADDNLLKMQIAFQLGQLEESRQRYLEAAYAYATLVDEAKDYLLEIRGKIRFAVMLSNLEKAEQALELLETMREDRRNKEFASQIDYEIGMVLKNNGDIDLAEEQFSYVDTAYKRTDASAKSAYQLGLMNEITFKDYATALQNFNIAKGEFPSSEITLDAKKKADIYTNYFVLRATVTKYDSLQNLKLHPEIIGKLDSIRRIEQALRDSVNKFKTDSIALYVADSLREEGIEPSPVGKSEQKSAPHIDSVLSVSPNVTQRDSSLFVTQTDSLHILSDSTRDSVKNNFAEQTKVKEKNIWDEGDEEEIKDSTTHSQITRDTLAVSDSAVISGHSWLKDTIKIPLSELRDSLSTKEYELGVWLENKMGLHDSAIYYFNRALATSSQSAVIPKVLYVLADFFPKENNVLPLAAESLYIRIVNEFPRHPVANAARKILGRIEQDTLSVDSLQQLYNIAEDELNQKKYDDAFEKFEIISYGDSSSQLIPKALYAMGWLYENYYENYDSAVSCYKLLQSKYPASPFAQNVARKVAGFDGRDIPFNGKKKYRTDELKVNINFERSTNDQRGAGAPSQTDFEKIEPDFPDFEEDRRDEEESQPPEDEEPPEF